MTTVFPKLLFCEVKRCQVPVWEIVTENRDRIYYERVHHEGYQPIGVLNSFSIDDTNINVCGTVKHTGKTPIVVLMEQNGYVAPMSWYERIMTSNLNTVTDGGDQL